jgi:ferredoxin
MKILVDTGNCDGYGNCVLAAPDVFGLDDSGKVVVLDPETRDAAAVKQAVRDCPARVIKVEA